MSIDPRDEEIVELKRLLRVAVERIDLLETDVVALRAENTTLKAELVQLRARLNQNSHNSSKPPSTDGPQVPPRESKPKGRKRGGQPGHEGAERRLLAPDEIIDHRPARCRRCARRLSGEDCEATRFQVFELPELKPHVTEHRGHALTCPDCGAITREPLPPDVLANGFGPRLSAFVAYLSGRCRLSKRQVVELCDDALGTPISLGSVSAIEQDVASALAAPVEEARALVRMQPVVHLDETGWREDKQLAWLWTAVTPVATVFTVARSRGKAVAREILGEDFGGHLVTDRWNAYNWVASERRQICWSHLLRDMEGMVERRGVGAELALKMRAEAEKMFDWWAQVRDGSLSRWDFQVRMRPVRVEISSLLRDAGERAEAKTAGMCREILKLEPALWTFVRFEGIEPTNNIAERAIRPAVLWRKGSFGNDSAAGSRFSERILTAVATVRQRGANVLRYLADACTASRDGHPAPSLVALAAGA